jgi:hypothetical protein
LILLTIVLAFSWHVGLFWLERSRRPNHEKPSLVKLLHLVEFDLLNTLRGELIRLLRKKPELKSRYGERLQEVSDRLNKLGDRNVP